MKRTALSLVILILLFTSACNLQAPGADQPTPFIAVTDTPAAPAVAAPDTAVPVQPPASTEAAPPPSEAAPAAAQPTAAPPTSAAEASTAYPAPATAQPTSAVPTATQLVSTLILSPILDPRTAYGEPDYENPMEIAYLTEWAQAETRLLPNNSSIRLQFKDGELYVTGKRPGFSTWWFSYHTLSDAFIELTFETEDCSDNDAYGIIFHGPPHLAGVSYGYIVSVSCNGTLRILRLDDADPYDAETLFEADRSSVINTGPDEENVIGVRAEGERFVVFANGVQVAEVEDDHFEKGRVGVFVRAAWPGTYIYRLTNFAYWILGEED